MKKEKKLYLFDYAGIDSPAAKFENNDNQRRSLAVVAAVTKFVSLGSNLRLTFKDVAFNTLELCISFFFKFFFLPLT